MRVLAITPKVDPSDDLLGFIHTWMSHLARRVERLFVLQLWDAPSALPSNTSVFTMGKDGGVSKPGQLARFTRVVGRLCLRHEVDVVLAHMGPIFAVCAAPFCHAAGIPLVLWYAHGAVSPTLRLAHRLVDRVGTSTPDGFRIPSTKVTITGQGIDTERFTPPGSEPLEQSVLSVGRMSPVKDYETIIRAFALLGEQGLRPRLQVAGSAKLESERLYAERVRAYAERCGLGAQVQFLGGVPHHEVADLYRRSTLFVSASRTGSLDKAVLEALATARPAVTCNEAFRELFGQSRDQFVFPPGDAAALAARMQPLLTLSAAERRQLGLTWRDRVVREHGVDHLADMLVQLLQPTSARA